MELGQLEHIANMFLKFCEQHPELCPHDYIWTGSGKVDENGYRDAYYVCGICKHEHVEKEKDRWWKPEEKYNEY